MLQYFMLMQFSIRIFTHVECLTLVGFLILEANRIITIHIIYIMFLFRYTDDLFSLNQLKLITNLKESMIIYDSIRHSTQLSLKVKKICL